MGTKKYSPLVRPVSRRDFLKGVTGVGVALGLGGLTGCVVQPVAPAPTQAPVEQAPAETEAEAMPAEEINLDFIVWSYSVETVLDNIKLFEEQYPGYTVNLTDYSWTAYRETMVNRFTSNTPTDVAYSGGDWLPEWAKAGWLVPLEDYFPQVKEYESKIVGYALKDMTYDGKLYGLPYYADITSFLYNEKLLNENGIEKPAESWEELAEQLKFLQDKGMEAPMALEFAQAMPTTLENFTAMVFGRGGELFNEDFEVQFNDENSAAWQQLQWLADQYAANTITLLPHETDVVKALNTGAHIYTVLYNYNLAELNNSATSPLAGQYKLALMPGETHETYGFAKFYTMTQMCVDRGPEVMDAAWKFIEYFGGEHEGQYKVAKRWAVEKGLGFGQLPLYDDPDVQESFAQWIDPAMLKEQAQKARGRNQTVWYGIWAEFMRLELVRAVSGETTVAEAMQAAADKAEELKAQFAG
jgi:multiple sugar transport system substrate-binding protein